MPSVRKRIGGIFVGIAQLAFVFYMNFIFTLTYSHHRPQALICRAFKGREG